MKKAEVKELAERIKPVVRYAQITARGRTQLKQNDEGDPYYIKEVDPYNVAFTWDPKPERRAYGLKEIERITTYHSYGYAGFFKPSIAEVLEYIPKDCIDDVVAFETLADSACICDNSHSATTILYGKKTVKELDDEIAEMQRTRDAMVER